MLRMPRPLKLYELSKPRVRHALVRRGQARSLPAVLAAGLTGLLLMPAPTAAQTGRLTVRPRDAATATRTAQAGEYTLDSIGPSLVYVPKQAVGTRRVPLVVFFGGGGVDPRRTMATQRPFADKYGMILLVPGTWHLDDLLQRVLRQFAIDPEKIGLTGSSVGGAQALAIGCENGDVFSRVAPISFLSVERISELPCADTARPLNRRTRFFLDEGLDEDPGALHVAGKYLRQNGHIVQEAASFRSHQWSAQEHNHVWRWFKESWTRPNNGVPPARARDVRKVPELNAVTFGKLKTFWLWLNSQPEFKAFWQWPASHPLSMWETGPGRRPRPTIVVAGQDNVAIYDMLDMPKFAHAYPSIMTGLRKVGWTPQQEQDYLTAFVGAYIMMRAKAMDSTVTVPAAMARNVAFLASHAVVDTITFSGNDVDDMLDYVAPLCSMSYTGLPIKTCPNLDGWLKFKARAIQDRLRERRQQQQQP